MGMPSNRRIVLFGPPLCGKRTLMKVFAESHASTVDRIEISCGSESVPHLISRAWLPSIAVELLTIGGAVWSFDAWWPFLAESSAVALTLDSQSVRAEADREHILELLNAPLLPRLGCVIWTKDDLVTTHGLERAKLSIPTAVKSESLWRSSPDQRSNGPLIANWPTFSTRMDDNQSMLAPVAFLTGQLEGP